MRVTVSLPDPLFEKAEALASRLGKSRNQLYAEAISEHVVRFDSAAVTDRMNRVLDAVGGSIDPALDAAALETLRRAEW